METSNGSHAERIERMRREYREAHERFVTRLRNAPEDAVHAAPPDGGWSAAQIGWHVAAVDSAFAGVITGEIPSAQPLPEGLEARPWQEVAAGIPNKIDAGKRVNPPAAVAREDALAALAAASGRLDAALAGLTEERGARYAITHPTVGTVALAQIGEWAIAHTIRHNAQAKRTLGQ